MTKFFQAWTVILGILLGSTAFAQTTLQVHAETFKRDVMKREIIQSRYPTPANVDEILKELCTKASTCPSLIISDYPPLIRAGLTRIVIDKSLLELPDNQLYAVLAHEFSHVKNKDIQEYLNWFSAQALDPSWNESRLDNLMTLSKVAETKADLFALEMLHSSKYPLSSLEEALISITTQKTNVKAINKSNSHPDTLERILLLKQTIKEKYHDQTPSQP